MTPNAPSHTALNTRMLALLDQFPANCDPDFDLVTDELEREFAELRLNLPNL